MPNEEKYLNVVNSMTPKAVSSIKNNSWEGCRKTLLGNKAAFKRIKLSNSLG